MKIQAIILLLIGVNMAEADQSRWIDYSNINDVSEVAITGNTIWSNTTGGLVQWDSETKTWEKFMPTYGMQFSVKEVSVAPNGDVWISAFNELIRYDGMQLEVFTKEDVDVEGGIVAIEFESNGNVWVGNKWGYASRYDGEMWTEFGEESGLAHYIYAIVAAPDGSVWFGTWGSGVFHYIDSNFIHYSETEGLIDDRVLSLTVDTEGKAWVATAEGISAIHGNSISTYPLGWTDTICTGSDGTIWAAVADFHPDEPISSVYRFDGSSMEPYDIGADSVRINKIVEDPVDGIWFCTNKWLGHMTDEGWEYYKGESELFLNTINAMETSSDGSVWFGHNRGPGAISRFIDDEWILYPSDDGQLNDIVRCIHEDKNGRVWFGPALCYYENDTWTPVTDVDGIGSISAISISSAKDGTVWFGRDVTSIGGTTDKSKNVIWKYCDDTWTGYSMNDGVIDSGIYTITIDNSNNVWAGTYNGVCWFNGSIWENATTSDELKNCIFLTTDSSGIVWACTTSGVFYYSNNTWKHFTASDGTIPTSVRVIAFDNKGGIWMGTDSNAGLLYDDGSQLHTFTTENGLPNNLISSLDIASDGSLWVGTAGGVSRYIYQNDTLVEAPIIQSFEVFNNYPNPFNPSTTISYSTAEEGHVTLSVYSLSGQKVATLVDSPMPAGTHQAVFDGTGLASGLYVYRLESGDVVKCGKMMLVK